MKMIYLYKKKLIAELYGSAVSVSSTFEKSDTGLDDYLLTHCIKITWIAGMACRIYCQGGPQHIHYLRISVGSVCLDDKIELLRSRPLASPLLLIFSVGSDIILWASLTATPTPMVLSTQQIGAPVFKTRGWANSQLTNYHSLHCY